MECGVWSVECASVECGVLEITYMYIVVSLAHVHTCTCGIDLISTNAITLSAVKCQLTTVIMMSLCMSIEPHQMKIKI